MRNPHQSDAFFYAEELLNLLQELKPKCSQTDFGKGEAEKYNRTKKFIEKSNTHSWNEELLLAHFIHSFSLTFIFLSQISCNFFCPQDETCASRQINSPQELLNH